MFFFWAHQQIRLFTFMFNVLEWVSMVVHDVNTKLFKCSWLYIGTCILYIYIALVCIYTRICS